MEEEVHNSIMGMKGDKTHVPDRFSISFFQRCWDILKVDLMKVIDEFYYSEEFNEHLNIIFITLFPKKQNVKELRDFCILVN